MKVVFFGTSEVGLPVLDSLHLHQELMGIVTTPDTPVGRKQILTPSAIRTHSADWHVPTWTPSKVKDNADLVSALQNIGADIFIVVSYGKILPLNLINIPHFKTLNLHFSRLPEYRGASPMQFALLNGESSTAITIFVLDEFMDHGPIVAQEEVTIYRQDTLPTLAARLALDSAALLIKILPQYASGAIVPQPQNHELATDTKIITKDDGRINWSMSAEQIHNQWRAYYTWPGIWTTWQNKKLKILECERIEDIYDFRPEDKPGTILEDGVIICGNGGIKINSLQLEGRNAVTYADFCRGNKNFVHSKLD